MRFVHPDGSIVHLSYCTNVHPAEDLDGIVDQLERYAEPVRKSLGWPQLGVGLWLAAPVAHELANDRAKIDRLKDELGSRNLEVVTFNGFPYEAFQAPVVKHAVYSPNWTEPDRLTFTTNLASILHRLLPDDAEYGSVSTLPIGWQGVDVEAAKRNLRSLADSLKAMADEHGRPVRVAVEPEPGCVVEFVDQAIDVLAGLAPDFIGLCLDACHLAVQFEEPVDAVARLADAEVPIVKSQVSSALRVSDPRSSEWVGDFVEPRFLHQTRERTDSVVNGTDDLDQAAAALKGDSEWRVHFHVPVHEDSERTTQSELRSTIAALVGGSAPVTKHLEVETYTWSVLPEDRRPEGEGGLVAGLALELEWVASQLSSLGMNPRGRE